MNAFFLHLLSTVTDDELDADYCPSASSKSQRKQKKQSRSSRMLSTSSVRSAKRVQDVVAGVIPRPPTLMDSCGEEYDPPTVSASKTLESRYSFLLLVVCTVLVRSRLFASCDAPFEIFLCRCFSR